MASSNSDRITFILFWSTMALTSITVLALPLTTCLLIVDKNIAPFAANIFCAFSVPFVWALLSRWLKQRVKELEAEVEQKEADFRRRMTSLRQKGGLSD